MSKQTIYALEESWIPGGDIEWPMVVVYTGHAEIVLGDMPLEPKDLREFAALCIKAAEDLEASK